MSKKIFSLACLPNRKENLKIILPIILPQADLLYLNLVNFDKSIEYPIVKDDKIIINKFKEKVGSQNRFYNYNDVGDDTYYFTIDDDLLYPNDYSEKLIKEMLKNDNKCICCVHGGFFNFKRDNNYRKGRKSLNYGSRLIKTKRVMYPGVGTSCFYKKYFKLNYNDFEYDNMSDCYIACFAVRQNIPIYSIVRNRCWIKNLKRYGTSIWSNNPIKHIDETINVYKDKLKEINFE